jgi:hypothetical protein
MIESDIEGRDSMYNPFDKELDKLTYDDLRLLIDNQVQEGFYIEYKSDFPTNKKIAKSIASFANTYGGWLIIGVEDETNTNIANDLVGIDLNANAAPLERIRSVVNEHLHTPPIFYSKIIRIDDDKGIIVILVPESFEAPHIMSNGVIYRRNGEQSTPIKETDRFTVDKIYNKSNKFEDRVISYFEDPFGITVGESNQNIPIMRLYFVPKNFNGIVIDDFFSDNYVDDIIDLINREEDMFQTIHEIQYSITFINFTRSNNSIICRSISNTIGFANYTFELFYNGVGRIRIPIPCNYFALPLSSGDNICLDKIYSDIGDELGNYRIVNLYELYLFVRFSIQKYIQFIKQHNISGNILISIEMDNLFRLIPHIECDYYLDYLEKYHVPVCLYENIWIPPKSYLNPWREVDIEILENDELSLIITIFNALGLSSLRIGDNSLLVGFVNYLQGIKQNNEQR